MRYAEMAKDRAALKTYIDTLAKVGEADFKGWSKHQQLAFLINAYNANMAEKILLRYPNIKSVWDYGKLIGNPFKDNFISLFGRKMIARQYRARHHPRQRRTRRSAHPHGGELRVDRLSDVARRSVCGRQAGRAA
jgi:Protein of unknown function, DUF547.